jgi:soluble lytic murein transglycosylase
MMELPRTAVLLMQMGDPRDAGIFLDRLGVVAADDQTREFSARLALGLGLPSSAVSIARTAGVYGQMLVREGWPMPVTPPDDDLPRSIAFGIMRQESSFNPNVVSGAGAVGLMQLMPATAQHTAYRDGIPYSDNLFDPRENMLIGSAYFDGLIKDFGNCLPLAIAAYNAGPTNVAHWLASNGDPELGHQAGGADIIDWVEEIPFNETRNYVQRVTESVVIYEALLHGTAEDPLLPWMQK